MSALLEADEIVEIRTSNSPGDSSHIVLVPGHADSGGAIESPQAYVLRARVEGTPVTALCGYTWVPQKDPLPLPVCATCLDIYRQDGKHRDEREDLPDA